MLRWVAILAAVGQLCWVGARVLNGDVRASDAFPVVLFCLPPTLAILALMRLDKAVGWLHLYLQRKALEEQKRIDALTSKS